MFWSYWIFFLSVGHGLGQTVAHLLCIHIINEQPFDQSNFSEIWLSDLQIIVKEILTFKIILNNTTNCEFPHLYTESGCMSYCTKTNCQMVSQHINRLNHYLTEMFHCELNRSSLCNKTHLRWTIWCRFSNFTCQNVIYLTNLNWIGQGVFEI